MTREDRVHLFRGHEPPVFGRFVAAHVASSLPSHICVRYQIRATVYCFL